MVFALVLGFVLASGCSAATQSGQTSARTQGSAAASSLSLRQILGPIGASRSRAQLLPVADVLQTFLEGPSSSLPRNDTGLSYPAAMLAFLVESPDVHIELCAVLPVLLEQEGASEFIRGISARAVLVAQGRIAILEPQAVQTSIDVQSRALAAAARHYQRLASPGDSALLDSMVEELRREGHLRGFLERRNFQCGD